MGKTINKLIKIGVFAGAVAGTMYAFNRYIEKAADTLNKFKTNKNSYYKWRLGNIYYEKSGEGSPVLLIHDYTPYASSYEWEKIVNKLESEHTVYTLDLLGCGRSDKPPITYTNFMYVQMITDFINDVIGEQTDIMTSGHASSLAIMSTNYTCENIKKLILINPADLESTEKKPTICSKIVKTVLEIPILGTFAYNMITLRKNIDFIIKDQYFYNPSYVQEDMIDSYYEAAHRKNGKGKYILSSILGNYMESNISYVLKSCKNKIFIIGGEQQENIERTIEEYKKLKPEIESVILARSKKLPHYETPRVVLEQIKEFVD